MPRCAPMSVRLRVLTAVALVVAVLVPAVPASAVAAPAVTALSATSGPTAGGTRVAVSGRNFTRVTAVSFGGVRGTTVSVASSTRLYVTAPAHAAGLVGVRVTTAYGYSGWVIADHYTYVAPPTISGLSATSGPAAGGTRVAVTGRNFSRVTAVSFGTAPGTSVSVVSSTLLYVTAPAHAAGLVGVRVTTAYGYSGWVTADHYTYVAPPAVSAVSPASGSTNGGTRVAVTGRDFTRVSAVRFGTALGTSISVTSSSRLYVTAPAHAAGLVDVRVTTAYGTSSGSATFDYQAPAAASALPLPADADPNTPEPSLGSIACPAAGTCWASGRYSDGDGITWAMLASLQDGAWTVAQAPLPADAESTVPDPVLDTVACGAPGSCAAIGHYTDADGLERPLLETLTSGAVTAAQSPLPGDADPSVAGARLTALACPAAGACVAAGTYLDAAEDQHGFVAMQSGATWTAVAAPVPADATSGVSVDSLACAAAGSCVAFGQYSDDAGTGHTFIDTLAGVTWSSATAPVDGVFSHVACPAAGWCVAVGGDSILTLSGGTWTASAAPTATGADASSTVDVTGLSCPAVGSCVVAGAYLDAYVEYAGGFLWTLSSGTWTAARAPVPAESGSPVGGYPQRLTAVSCAGVGSCTAVGAYDAGGLVETLGPRGWTVTSAPLPDDADVPAFGGLDAISCAPGGGCVAVGTYVAFGVTAGLIEAWG